MSVRNFQNLKLAKKDSVTIISFIVVIIFFASASYVAFIIDNPTRDHDLLAYYYAGQQTLYGDRENVYLAGTPIGWSVLLALSDNVVDDVFVTAKLVSVFFATGIVLLSFYIVKNIFNKQVALLAQTLIAITPFFHVEAIITHGEILPVFLIFFSFYFITKKKLSKRDVILCGIFLGLASMLRYQAAIIAISCVPFFLIQYKKIHLSKTILFSIFFIIALSPLLIFNFLTFGTFIESEPSYFFLHFSEFENNTAWEKTLTERIESTGSTAFFEIDEFFIKNYFYNLFVNNPNKIFQFTHDIANWSPIPFIQYVGIPLILGGAVLTFNRHIEKKEVLVLVTISFAVLIFLVMNDYTEYFFISIIIPVLILGIRSIKKIEQNVLPLLIIPVCFFVMMAIIQVPIPTDLFAILLIPPTLTALFILRGIPKIIQFKQLQNKKTIHVKIIIIFIISIIIFSNLIFSYELQAMLLYGDNFDWKDVFRGNHNYENSAHEMKQVGEILSKEPNIENKYIMTSEVEFAHYANAKYLNVGFDEGPQDATIMEYVSRQGWSDYDIAVSNIYSIPNDRYNKYNPLPEYLIYLDKPNRIPSLQVLQNPDDPNIPKNLELLYKNDKSGIFVYKIKYE
jgi:4-amino-4-deoxy-L-arabinose transferase-like glycosyltransferase